MSFVALFDAPASIVAASFVVGGALGAALSRKPGAAKPSRDAIARRRTGRLPLPPQVADLTPSDEPSLDRVNAFADRLAAFPLATWLDIGRDVTANAESQSGRSTARVILDAIIADRELGVVAWYAKDAIETSAFMTTRSGVRMSSADRRAFSAAHGAAEVAALALLAREYLSAEDFAALYLPFADDTLPTLP